jgi:methylmalonyl-CoA mutase
MHGANISEISSALGYKEGAILKSGKLNPIRAMQNIETLRMDVQNSPANSSIFMCNIGKLAQIKPRVDFSVGFLQVAGFEVINKGAYDDPETALKAYQASGAKALCICATDDTYPQIVENICHKSGTKAIILAGYPADMVETYQRQGVKIFIHLKANAHSTLKQIAQMMEVVL